MMLDDSWSARRSGRVKHADDVRTDAEIDYARIVHSGSFRRLQGKTQILSLGDDDFYRTRLTHSLEVAQVAEGLVQHLKDVEQGELKEIIPSGAQVRALGLAHDIGHPPFGHGGEVALNYCMRDAGGFEGNAQTLRIVTALEPYSDHFGADLTRRTLLGLLKYPATKAQVANPQLQPKLLGSVTTFGALDPEQCKPAKACYDSDAEVIAWILDEFSSEDRRQLQAVEKLEGTDAKGKVKHGKTVAKSLDCSIMDEADNIAYGVHDMEDALALQLIDEEHFRAVVGEKLCKELLAQLQARPVQGVTASYDGIIAGLFGEAGPRKRLIGRLVHHFIKSANLDEQPQFDHPLLRYRLKLTSEAEALLKGFRDLINDHVIQNARVQQLDFKGQRLVVAVFEALISCPKSLLSPPVFAAFDKAGDDKRLICDYVASMTDGGLMRAYDRLFSPRMGTIFDRL